MSMWFIVFACFQFYLPLLWGVLRIMPDNLSNQILRFRSTPVPSWCSLTGCIFAGTRRPTAGPFRCGAMGCLCVFRAVTGGELNVSPHLRDGSSLSPCARWLISPAWGQSLQGGCQRQGVQFCP